MVDVGHNDIVLGMAWLDIHDPKIGWKEKTVAFTSAYCIKNCLANAPLVKVGQPPNMEIMATQELPMEYKIYWKVFAEEETTPLPPHRQYDIAIDLKEDARPRHGPIYSIGVKEDQEMQETIKRQLSHGLIRHSKSPVASPVIFVKKNGKLHMYIDYCRLNKMTIKNMYPLPRTNNLVEKL